MGYYSSLETDARINKDKLDELKLAIQEEIKKETEMASYWLEEDFIKLEPTKEGIIYLDFEEWDCKHYEDEEFIHFIQPFLDYEYNDHYEFKFYGEDDEMWGYSVYKDKIRLLVSKWEEEE
jgi:hypothetical protein